MGMACADKFPVGTHGDGIGGKKQKSPERTVPGFRIMSPQMPLGRHPEPEFSWVTFLLHQAHPT